MARWIRVEPKDAITVLTLDRQARRNAMHAEVWQELEQVATELAASPPRVLVVPAGTLGRDEQRRVEALGGVVRHPDVRVVEGSVSGLPR